MRAPKRRRPLRRARSEPPPSTDLAVLADRAAYVISSEHKDYLTEVGPGALRSDATPCPRDVAQGDAQTWLREALRSGDFGGGWTSSGYPRYAWRRVGHAVYEARLTNDTVGSYKGYPLDPSEWPRWLS